jgi:dihydroorotase
MLVDNPDTLAQIFAQCQLPVAVHCEHEPTVKSNLARFKEQYGEQIPVQYHPAIRDTEACYRSSAMAVELAQKYNTRLHILHLSSAKELSLLDNTTPSSQKRITAEACVHHLWFDDRDYATRGAYIRWNPSIKSENDKLALVNAVNNGKIDVIATDHAPHTIEEKQAPYTSAMSGGPLVQHSLVAMLELYLQGKTTLQTIVNKMCHTPADIFQVQNRGYLRPGYYADLVVVSTSSPWTVSKENILYKCGWSPFEGTTFSSKVLKTFVNGNLVFDNGSFDLSHRGSKLTFSR